jgi:hypothetical protein
VFVGIDHSAVAVSETAAGEASYGGLPGMSIAYEVANRGLTQDALDGTHGAVVRITGLRPGSPAGQGSSSSIIEHYRRAVRRHPIPRALISPCSFWYCT